MCPTNVQQNTSFFKNFLTLQNIFLKKTRITFPKKAAGHNAPPFF